MGAAIRGLAPYSASKAGLSHFTAALRADLVHFPTIFAPALLPSRYVLTIHDLIHLRYPALFGASTAAFYRLLVGRLARRAARLERW